MSRKFTLVAAATSVAIAATVAFGGGHNLSPEQAAMKARKAHMNLAQHHQNVLVAMSRGAMDYNADIAQGSADALAALSTMSQMTYWPQNSDSETLEGSRAKPEIWQNLPDVFAKAGANVEAAAALQAVAGTKEGLDSALRGLIQSCNDCHRSYSAPFN